ncbi:MAG: SAM-dependent methyltransferase [Spirochaetota bacterium]|nr:MAG: SAM-dependent methyltransferase [Spirochaetota bacterium]
MAQESDIRNIADASKPNAGRIYDFLLGGNHNFEIDRQAAQQVIQILPGMPQMVRLVRWFLGEATRRLCDEGFKKFLDFASGLPTVDHIHQVALKGTKVIYSDIDPVTVAYAHDIIGDNPNIRYVQCNAGKPEELLDSDVVEELFGKDRKVAIGFNGIAYFLSDETMEHSLEVLYNWADKGSKIFISDIDMAEISDGARKMEGLYKQLGQPIFWRTKKRLSELVKKWKVTDPGYQAMEKWVDIDWGVSDEVKKGFGATSGYGVILEK